MRRSSPYVFIFALREISFSRKDHQTPSLVGLCRAASRSKTKLLSRARALGLALNSSEKCQMCKFHNVSANYVHRALLCSLPLPRSCLYQIPSLVIRDNLWV